MKIVFRTPNGGPVGADPSPVERVKETLPAAVGPGRKLGPGSTDPKEFLAFHARLRYEQARVRRWKQVGFLISVAAVGAAATVITCARHRKHDVTQTMVATARVLPTQPAASPVMAAVPAESGALAVGSPAVESSVDPAAAAVVASASVPASEAASRCADEFGQRRWLPAIEACILAFDEHADPAVALRVGHAQFATDHVDLAGLWATKAVDLGSEDADAYVLIGHAERQAGHPRGAMAAYRKYLRASPRGWHARTVRAALRDLKQKALVEAGQVGGQAIAPASPDPGDPAEEPRL